jgi:PilZ domain
VLRHSYGTERADSLHVAARNDDAKDLRITLNVNVPSKDRRKEPRESFSTDVEVSGIDQSGHPFREVTKSLDVSQSGCRFVLSIHLARNSVVTLRVLGETSPLLSNISPIRLQVMYTIQSRNRWVVGALKNPETGTQQ